jgi:L-histidine Nalpha-methyltransferase
MSKLETQRTSVAVATTVESARPVPRMGLQRRSEPGGTFLGRAASERYARMAEDVLDGLTRPFKELPSKYLYDTHGAALYERICELPEYYPARCERSLLELRAGEIAQHLTAHELLELGPGNASKTRLLLDALARSGMLERYIPVDVSTSTVAAASEIAEHYPGLAVHAVVGDFESDLNHVPGARGPRLVALLGGTVGNLAPGSRRRLLRRIAALLGPRDRLLVGWSLVTDPQIARAAYDDQAGVTAAFNRNVLSVLNSEFDADFEPAAFEHVALFDPHRQWVEMRLRARHAHDVRLRRLGLHLQFRRGEEIRTEISARFTQQNVLDDFSAAGLSLTKWVTDRDERVALSLARRALIPLRSEEAPK